MLQLWPQILQFLLTYQVVCYQDTPGRRTWRIEPIQRGATTYERRY